MAKKQQKQQADKKQDKTKSKITKNTLIGTVAARHPEAVEVMFKHGLHCIGCPMTAYETVEQGCKAHGMSDEDIDKMVKEINEAEEEKK